MIITKTGATIILLCVINVRGDCVFEDGGGGEGSLRCRQNADFRTLRNSFQQILNEIHIIDVYKGRIPVIENLVLKNSSTSSVEVSNIKTRSISIVRSGVTNVTSDAFNGFSTSLRRLDLSGNELSIVPLAVLKNLMKLEYLDLSGNSIISLPPGSAFNNLNSLTFFDLSQNLLGNKEENLSLLKFNLEPLTDTLQVLLVRDNGLTGLPNQFIRRNFPRLRHLDISHNDIQSLPSGSFQGMKELEKLDLSYTELSVVVLDKTLVEKTLTDLYLDGNPIQCDCHARWLWSLTQNNSLNVHLPPCATPFNVKNSNLKDLKAVEVCELLPGETLPRFFRVTDQDKSSFPPNTFESLSLEKVMETSPKSISISWALKLVFYYTDYDWGLIFREIALNENSNKFYKTPHDLKTHIGEHTDWTPKDERFNIVLADMKPDTYYEICLAVIDHSTVYYIHRNHCREVRTQRAAPISSNKSALRNSLTSSVSTGTSSISNLTYIPGSDTITITWNVEVTLNPYEVKTVRKISIRQFGSKNVTQLYVLEDFNVTSSNGSRYYTLSDLKSGTAFVICCFSDHLDEDEVGSCGEVFTTAKIITFPVTEVATATAVSSTTTALVVAIVCCCFPSCCKKKATGTADDRGRGGKDDKEEGNSNSKEGHSATIDNNNETTSSSSSYRDFNHNNHNDNNKANNNNNNKKLRKPIRKTSFKKKKYTVTEKNKKFPWSLSCMQNSTGMSSDSAANPIESITASSSEDTAEPLTKTPVEDKSFKDRYAPPSKARLVLGPPWDESKVEYADIAPCYLRTDASGAPGHPPPPNYGPGSYHTISHYQFYKRPVPVTYYSSGRGGNNALPRPAHVHHCRHHHHSPTVVLTDYAKTLGRTRRESPMATVKPKTTVAGTTIELKPIHHRYLKQKESAFQNKMYTWSPYSDNNSHQFENYPYQEPFLLHHHNHHHHSGKSLNELRF